MDVPDFGDAVAVPYFLVGGQQTEPLIGDAMFLTDLPHLQVPASYGEATILDELWLNVGTTEQQLQLHVVEIAHPYCSHIAISVQRLNR